MSTWNYRIVKYRDGSGFGLHEVYYREDGSARAMTESPISFACDAEDDPDEITDALVRALKDACRHPVFEEPAEWNTED